MLLNVEKCNYPAIIMSDHAMITFVSCLVEKIKNRSFSPTSVTQFNFWTADYYNARVFHSDGNTKR